MSNSIAIVGTVFSIFLFMITLAIIAYIGFANVSVHTAILVIGIISPIFAAVVMGTSIALI